MEGDLPRTGPRIGRGARHRVVYQRLVQIVIPKGK
jgi:hypothetical protein